MVMTVRCGRTSPCSIHGVLIFAVFAFDFPFFVFSKYFSDSHKSSASTVGIIANFANF